jgi:WD40 repeat protein
MPQPQRSSSSRAYWAGKRKLLNVTLVLFTVGHCCSCAKQNLLVCSLFTNSVLEYDGTTGAFVTAFVPSGSGGLTFPGGLTVGPNGNLFVSSSSTNSVLEYNGTTGAFITAFVAPGSGGLNDPLGLTFGPNGNLFVGSAVTRSVLEYNGTTGAFVTAFVPSSSGGLIAPSNLAFHGNLFVAAADASSVLEYDGTTGAFVTAFVPSGSGGLCENADLIFGSNGNLFVGSGNNPFCSSNSVLEYNGTSGAFITAFVPSGSGGLTFPGGLAFGPNGNLFVSSLNANSVLEYNGTTGAFITTFVSPGSGGLSGTGKLTFFTAPSASATSSRRFVAVGVLLLLGAAVVLFAYLRSKNRARSTPG